MNITSQCAQCAGWKITSEMIHLQSVKRHFCCNGCAAAYLQDMLKRPLKTLTLHPIEAQKEVIQNLGSGNPLVTVLSP